MKIYAVIGSSQQTVIADNVQYSPQENEVLMQSERPTDGDYVATVDGTWELDKTPQIEALDAEFAREKARLCEEYTDSNIHGDTETAEAIIAEMTELEEWYDSEYEKIINGEAE